MVGTAVTAVQLLLLYSCYNSTAVVANQLLWLRSFKIVQLTWLYSCYGCTAFLAEKLSSCTAMSVMAEMLLCKDSRDRGKPNPIQTSLPVTSWIQTMYTADG
jgi:hypothetical protein